ncbi:hypothetical protein [Flavicella marina]|uniref:hypothetical protein n=1 Tax=Flavicella marina TaxID=1475951 RepID=UPI0012648C29|nr:hypothetical protein [Flavicella marina]
MDTTKIIINNASRIFMGIVIYFFAMKLLGLENITELRLFNFLIVIWGVNTAIKQNIEFNKNNLYLSNLSIGFSTAVFAVVAVAFSLIFYITFLNYDLLHIMENSRIWGNHLTLERMIFAILIEGLASSVICTFIVMQYWKKHKVDSLIS